MSLPKARDLTLIRMNTLPATDGIVQPEVTTAAPEAPEDATATTQVVGASSSTPASWTDHVSFPWP